MRQKQGYLTQLAQQHRVHLLAEDINPISLLQNVDKVYCVTSQMGFEALLCGKPLTTFGLPWYAGWGVSDDRHPEINRLVQTQRRATRNLLQLFAAAYLQYSRYLNPNTGEAGSLFDVIDYLATVKRKTTNCVASYIASVCLCGNARLPNRSLTYPLAV